MQDRQGSEQPVPHVLVDDGITAHATHAKSDNVSTSQDDCAFDNASKHSAKRAKTSDHSSMGSAFCGVRASLQPHNIASTSRVARSNSLDVLCWDNSKESHSMTALDLLATMCNSEKSSSLARQVVT